MGFLQRAFGGGGAPQGENILSSLSSPPVKALQVAGSQVGQQYDPSMPEDRYAPAAVQQTNSADEPRAPRPRRSTMETIGLIGDLIARAQGGPELYQPFQDAQHARDRQAIQEPMQDTLNQQKIEAGQSGLDAEKMSTLGQALGALSDNPDAIQQWPQIAEQLGVKPEKAAQIGQLLQSKPGMANALAQSLGWKPGDKFSGQVVYGKDKAGNTVAYQPGTTGDGRVLNLGDGVSPVNPSELAATSRERIAGQGNSTRERIATGNNRTRIITTKMATDQRAAAAAGKAGGGAADPNAIAGASSAIESLKSAGERLYRSGGMSGPGNNTLNVIARENLPGYERLTNSQGYSARQDYDTAKKDSILNALSVFSSIKLGQRNFDTKGEAERWEKLFGSATDYPSFQRTMSKFENRIEELKGIAARQPAATAPAARANVQPRRATGAGGGGKTLVYNPKTGKIE